jgi:hypothetical protein
MRLGLKIWQWMFFNFKYTSLPGFLYNTNVPSESNKLRLTDTIFWSSSKTLVVKMFCVINSPWDLQCLKSDKNRNGHFLTDAVLSLNFHFKSSANLKLAIRRNKTMKHLWWLKQTDGKSTEIYPSNPDWMLLREANLEKKVCYICHFFFTLA